MTPWLRLSCPWRRFTSSDNAQTGRVQHLEHGAVAVAERIAQPAAPTAAIRPPPRVSERGSERPIFAWRSARWDPRNRAFAHEKSRKKRGNWTVDAPWSAAGTGAHAPGDEVCRSAREVRMIGTLRSAASAPERVRSAR